MKPKITVIGSTNTDMVVTSKRMPRPGETVLGGTFMMNAGGKGANQAVAAARLGGEVAFVGKTGADLFGEATRRNLNDENIDISHLSQTADAASGVALINVDSTGENSISVAPGANALLSEADVEAAAGIIAESKIVMLQLETPLTTVARAAALAHGAGVKVLLNPAPAPAEPLPANLLANVDIIVPNLTETEIITGLRLEPYTPEKGKQALEALRALGVAVPVITIGAEGAIALDGEKVIHVEAEKVQAIDTTAAGDTFCGALAVGLAEGQPLAEAMRLGCRASGVAVTRPGAQSAIPYRNEIK